jgi:hypothetical protein
MNHPHVLTQLLHCSMGYGTYWHGSTCRDRAPRRKLQQGKQEHKRCCCCFPLSAHCFVSSIHESRVPFTLTVESSYGSTMDASTYVYVSEIWPTHLRARGCAISTSGLFVASLILLIAASDAFAAIGWKYYLVFLCMTVLGALGFALFLPEVSRNIPNFNIFTRNLADTNYRQKD